MPDIRKREAMEREAALLRRDCRRKLGMGIEKATVEVATVGVMEEVEIGTTIKEDIMGTDMVGEIIGVKRADIKIREVAMNDGMTVDTTGTNGHTVAVNVLPMLKDSVQYILVLEYEWEWHGFGLFV